MIVAWNERIKLMAIYYEHETTGYEPFTRVKNWPGLVQVHVFMA